MKFIKNQFSLWRIVLFVGVMALAIPIAASLSPTVTAVEERHEYLVPQTGINTEPTETKHGGATKATAGKGAAQGYYWDRRRRYWEDRIENDLDDEDTGDDDADKTDSKEDDAKDDDGFTDEEYDRMERRREYWRQSLEDEDW
jgi:hypothetical protein